MKYRSDFVTNSSSSSFICAFKNKAEFSEMMEKYSQTYPQHFAYIYKDILEHRRNRKEILNELKEYYEGEAEYSIYWSGKNKTYWDGEFEYAGLEYYNRYKLPAYKQAIDEYINKRMDYAEANLPKRGILASIEYSDEDGGFFSELEHDIMPRMPFVFAILSHH